MTTTDGRPTPEVLHSGMIGGHRIEVLRFENRVIRPFPPSRYLYQLQVDGVAAVSIAGNDHTVIDALPAFVEAIDRDRPTRMGEPDSRGASGAVYPMVGDRDEEEFRRDPRVLLVAEAMAPPAVREVAEARGEIGAHPFPVTAEELAKVVRRRRNEAAKQDNQD